MGQKLRQLGGGIAGDGDAVIGVGASMLGGKACIIDFIHQKEGEWGGASNVEKSCQAACKVAGREAGGESFVVLSHSSSGFKE